MLEVGAKRSPAGGCRATVRFHIGINKGHRKTEWRKRISRVGAGEIDGRAVAMSVRRSISAEQRRALRLLADNPVGCTEAIVLAHGFTSGLIEDLVREGSRPSCRGPDAPGGDGLRSSG
jgi:hypothetical protein